MKGLFLAFLIASAGFLACSHYDHEMETILRLTDRRAPVQKLQPFLQHPAKKVRQEAINALGKMLDTTAVALILPFLDDSSPELRVEAVFALGQLGTFPAQIALMKLWQKESDLQVRQSILEALGKIGDADVVDVLKQGLHDEIPVIRAEAALSIGRLAYRHIPLQGMPRLLAPLFAESLNEIRWRAAYALMRLSDTSSYRLQLRALRDKDARVRMFAARGLGTLGNPEACDSLARIAQNDLDWRVRVNAAQAIGRLAPDNIFALLPLNDDNEHVRLTALQALETASQSSKSRQNKLARDEKLNEFLQHRIHPDQGHKMSWREQATAANVYAAIHKEKAINLLAGLANSNNDNFRARLASALGKTETDKALLVLRNLFEKGPGVVKVAVLNALKKYNQPQAIQIYEEALGEKDQVLTAISANAFAQKPDLGKKYGSFILRSFQELSQPIDVEAAAMIFNALAELQVRGTVPVLEKQLAIPDKAYAKAAAQALEKLTGKSYAHRVPAETQPHQEFHFQDIQKLRGKTAIIEMRYGKMVLELFPNDAPLTTLNFVQLARQGFYNGLTFHRVVANFVIQGGDPRGDSWGSPGYDIRSEFNRHHYLRGMMGMASAGPDTEGSQFFITHSVQPHLDGRYTIFGRVLKGGKVLDAIQAGDEILAIRITK